MRLLRHPLFLAVSFSHFMVDLLMSQIGVLLAALSVPLRLSNASIGLIATVCALVGSLTQPLFGWLSDRHGAQWATAGGVLWLAAFFALVAVAPGYWAIVFLIVAALGSGAFHPPGTAEAVHVGYLAMAGHAATAASIFILFGQGGQSLGPAIGGFLLDHWGRPGLIAITLVGIPIGAFTAWQLRPAAHPRSGHGHERKTGSAPASQPDIRLFVLTMILAALRTWAQAAVTTFAPKYFHDQGVSATIYGAIVAVFMAGAALGGILSDRWNRQWTIGLSLAISVAPLYVFPLMTGGWTFPLAFVSGLTIGAPHSVFITMAQRSLPGRAGLASGVALGCPPAPRLTCDLRHTSVSSVSSNISSPSSAPSGFGLRSRVL